MQCEKNVTNAELGCFPYNFPKPGTAADKAPAT